MKFPEEDMVFISKSDLAPNLPPHRPVHRIADPRDDARRAAHGAINLAQGFPDWDPPPALVQAAKDAMDAGRHQYAITWGAPELRTALAAKLTRFMGVPVDASANSSSPAARPRR
jgi:aspartate/methionine/tyrosine aminotransferase